MIRVAAIFLFVLASISSVSAQVSVDSVLNVPYDEMVANLEASEVQLSGALNITMESKSDSLEAEVRSKLSIVSYLLGNHETSLEHAIKAIDIFEKRGLLTKAGSLYCAIGYQMKRRDLPKANIYMQLGMSLLEAIDDTAGLTAAYNNYGVIKEMENNLDSAEYYYRKGLGLVEELNDSIGIPFSLNNLGGIYVLKEDYKTAESLFERSFQIRKARNDAYGILEGYILFGDVNLAAGAYQKAIDNYQIAINHTYNVGYPYMRQHCFEQLAIAHEKSGDVANALAANKAYVGLKDSLLEQQRTEQLAKMETRFETAQKEKENLALKQEKQERELVVSKQRNWIIGLTGGSLACLFLGLFIVQRNRRREAAKRDAAIIQERERGLRAIIQATEEERKRIAKDLHDGIVQSLTGLSLRIQKQATSSRAKSSGLITDLTETRGTLDDAIAEVRGISHQMMPRVLSEMGLVPAMDDMLNKSLGLTDIDFLFEHHNMEGERFKETLEISLYRITQELVNNIIKHSKAKAVSIQLLKTKNHLVLIVEDNGTGFEFDDPANRNGIGLMNITSRAKAINGEVHYEPSPKQGTVATVRVPLE